MNTNSSLNEVKGIGTKTEELFQKMGVYTVGDILLHFPRTYVLHPAPVSVGDIIEGEVSAVLGRVVSEPVVRRFQRMVITTTTIGKEEQTLQLFWYRMPYIKNNLKPGNCYIFYGKIINKKGHLAMEQPVIYKEEQYEALAGHLIPVYGLTTGLSNNLVIKTMRTVLNQELLITDYLPQDVRERQELCEYNYAVKQIHFPDHMDALILARKRLVFDEFFQFILSMQLQKQRKEKEKNNFSFPKEQVVEPLIQQLPYTLTNAQQRALGDVIRDMNGAHVMQRLIQGDVGSGKTIIAFLAMAFASQNGYQSAIMAPTEVLARQHYESFVQMCQQFSLDIPVILLTGSLTAKQKREAYQMILEHPTAMIIGTHALIQEKVTYQELALVITDEQHRFGVRQREIFSQKGKTPHIMVMSATPIPRTLAIILYGDLDISVIDEVPAHRLPIKNCVVDTRYRPKAYDFISSEVKKGHQAYVICPLVEESENMEAENVTDYEKKISKILGNEVQVGLLHGKMKPLQKNKVMEAFLKNEIQVLVSTTVVEVGVNVPNATVMMIENAERFGLAQLHQLRGRVGRGDAQSYCIMVNCSGSKNSMKRLQILNESNDGFKIASEDLKLRGPGDFFGIRQSGDMTFALADIYQDAAVLQQASQEVTHILTTDPKLEREEYKILGSHMKHMMEQEHNQLNL